MTCFSSNYWVELRVCMYVCCPCSRLRIGLARRVQSHPASACSSPYSGWIWCLLAGFLPSSAAASIYLFKPPHAIGPVPSLSGHAIAYRWRSLPRVRRHRVSKPQGSSKRVLPWQVTMDQFICLSFPHPLLVWSGHAESTGGSPCAGTWFKRIPKASNLKEACLIYWWTGLGLGCSWRRGKGWIK